MKGLKCAKHCHDKPSPLFTAVFIVAVFMIHVATIIIVGFAFVVLVHLGVIREEVMHSIFIPIALLAGTSVIIGTVMAGAFSKIPLRPINTLIAGMNRLGSGDYSVRINFGQRKMGSQVADSFNTLAEELSNTELLRSDFVNNFSHEFKTPIVSIRGFAKLLQKGNLSDEQRAEYLSIIVDESTRLADMATNVLELTKVENQCILTDITHYNLSEQLRNCILLLEKKWTQKGLTVSAEFNEVYIDGNEELLKQVWINLIDNAVKFSDEGGEVAVTITSRDSAVTVSVTNSGAEIPEEERERIFRKFYQCDTSHSSQGTGIGLAIVKRIVQLHDGTIEVGGSGGKTAFSVTLNASGEA